jgi:hypothetical protein
MCFAYEARPARNLSKDKDLYPHATGRAQAENDIQGIKEKQESRKRWENRNLFFRRKDDKIK